MQSEIFTVVIQLALNKRDELRKKELMKAIESSNRSFDEVMRFLQGDPSEDDTDDIES